MKKQVLRTITVISMMMATVSFIGCGGSDQQDGEHHGMGGEHHQMEADSSAHHAEHTHAKYHCPMDCEDGKTYDEAGQCPKCGMDLIEVTSE